MKCALIMIVDADEEMGFNAPEDVKEVVEEAIRDSGLDNAANIKIELRPVELVESISRKECSRCGIDTRTSGKHGPGWCE